MMLHNQRGFTLTELLIALSVCSIIIAISSSYAIKTYDTLQYKQFTKQFHQDILYLQQLAFSQNENFYLHFERQHNRYHIRQGGFGRKLFVRNYPEHWVIEPNTLELPIEFSHKGNIKKPGTMQIRTRFQTFSIICPFGKGRCYDAT
ncbi:prepilin-type N-terminal cleavage/methylation domain-containing protein [Gracilibacillus salitolerans]|uniref:Prepilin-type N-terminal cleavage/methylation domain-containing protein n=1 Tax=Gracilibacillus salitolerans TaxID=2663022 RepID=A0A5Q2TLE9_9BACI|nr:competence type IV pilus minor pilin ComGD [Gracilibacillus salitolerans]QGH34917.1 prepilin-type N-terminal cleavage/methylation domain-containing protein [Gracilibacillus salitolerans]